MLYGNKNYIIKSGAVQALWRAGAAANGRREYKKAAYAKSICGNAKGIVFYQPQPLSPASFSRVLRMSAT